jgi:hypothetical protein
MYVTRLYAARGKADDTTRLRRLRAREPLAVSGDTVAALLREAGFAERTLVRRRRREPVSVEGFQVFGREDGSVLVCWIPAAGQDPRDLDAFGRSYDMAQAYIGAARKAGWRAERWGVIWHYALVTEIAEERK